MNGLLVNEATPYAIAEKVKGVVYAHIVQLNAAVSLYIVATSLLS